MEDLMFPFPVPTPPTDEVFPTPVRSAYGRARHRLCCRAQTKSGTQCRLYSVGFVQGEPRCARWHGAQVVEVVRAEDGEQRTLWEETMDRDLRVLNSITRRLSSVDEETRVATARILLSGANPEAITSASKIAAMLGGIEEESSRSAAAGWVLGKCREIIARSTPTKAE